MGKLKNSMEIKKIGLYIRVSTEEQAENPEGSIKNQEERLKEAVKFKNFDQSFGEIKGIFIDRAKSGKDTNRSELQRLLAAIRAREVDYVMVTELSRISRNMRDFSEIWDMMQKVGCGFQSLRENFETTTAAGEMVLFTMANLAQFERKQVSERVKANINARSKRGLYSGGTVPVGYKLIENRPGFLETDLEMAPLVVEAFRTFLLEGSLSPAARSLNARGYKLKRDKQGGGKYSRLDHFTVDNLHKMLRNPMYAGLKRFTEKGEIKISKAVWEPIIDGETFEKVQSLLTKNCGRKKPHSETRYPYLLSGITYCGECGDVMCGKSAHGRREKIGYYEHSWATKRNSTLTKKILTCSPHRVLAKRLEPVVWDEVKKLILDPAKARELLEEARRIHSDHSITKERESLKANVFGLTSQIEALAERLSQIPKSVSAAPIFKQMEKIERLKVEAETKLIALDQVTGVRGDPPVDIQTFETFLTHLKEFVTRDIDAPTKTKVIQKLVHKVQVFKDSVKIHFIVTKTHYHGELARKASSPAFFVPRGQKNTPDSFEGGGKNFFMLNGSNTLTVGASERT